MQKRQTTTTNTERLNIAFDRAHRERLQEAARVNNVSMNEFLRSAMTEKVMDQERWGHSYGLIRSLLERLSPDEIESALAGVASAKKGRSR